MKQRYTKFQLSEAGEILYWVVICANEDHTTSDVFIEEVLDEFKQILSTRHPPRKAKPALKRLVSGNIR